MLPLCKWRWAHTTKKLSKLQSLTWGTTIYYWEQTGYKLTTPISIRPRINSFWIIAQTHASQSIGSQKIWHWDTYYLSLKWEEQYSNLLEQQYQGIDVLQHIMAHLQLFFPTVGRTTVSTSLAMNNKQPLQDIPPAFQCYKKVFSDEEAQQLPRHQP